MPGQEVKIGPWPGGLNQRDSEFNVADNELTRLINFDVNDDGHLVGRRPILRLQEPLWAESDFPVGTPIHLLGVISKPQNPQITIAAIYKESENISGIMWTGESSLVLRHNTVWVGKLISVTQYNKKLYFMSSNGLGFMINAEGDLNTQLNTKTTINSPQVDDGFIYKDRMFAINNANSRIYYSKATDPAQWEEPESTGFFDVNPGDGQVIEKVIISSGSLIIFKTNSTWTFSYTSDPATDGFLRIISQDVGAFHAVVYNNEIYTINERSVFKFINGYFQDIADKLALGNTEAPTSFPFNRPYLNIVSNLLYAGPTYYGGKYYCMNLKTGAWSQHEYENDMSPQGEFTQANAVHLAAVGKYAIFSRNGRLQSIADFYPTAHYGDDTPNKVNKVVPRYVCETKRYHFETHKTWKRLYWHAIDGLNLNKMNMTINGKVVERSTRFLSLKFTYEAGKVFVVTSNNEVAIQLPLIPSPILRAIYAYMSTKSKISR